MGEIERFTVTPHARVPVEAFGGYLLSKNQWGWVLGKSERTLQRWEREIIGSNISFASIYHFKKIKPGQIINPSPLDGYRRFILLAIYSLKSGIIDGRKYSNSEVIEYFADKQDCFLRSNFSAWLKAKGVKS